MSLKQPELETDRCLLRCAGVDDLDALAAAVRSPLFPQRLPLAEMGETGQLLQRLEEMFSRSRSGSAFLWSIDIKEGPRCIGQVSLSARPNFTAWNAAYWLHPLYWGRGLAVETISGVIEVAFQSLDIAEVWTGVALWNQRSIGTLERLGFHFMGNSSAGYFVGGVAEPVHEYRLTRRDWQDQQSLAPDIPN
jgi:RimJ/RimL family protein N-acetyltransferase